MSLLGVFGDLRLAEELENATAAGQAHEEPHRAPLGERERLFGDAHVAAGRFLIARPKTDLPGENGRGRPRPGQG